MLNLVVFAFSGLHGIMVIMYVGTDANIQEEAAVCAREEEMQHLSEQLEKANCTLEVRRARVPSEATTHPFSDWSVCCAKY